jgi:membrane protein required for colicin V production
MEAIDLALLIILASFAANGLMQGMVRQLLAMVGFLLGFVLAMLFYPHLAAWLTRHFGWISAPQPVAFAIILLGIWILANISGFVLRKAVQPTERDWLDDMGGALLGLASGILLTALVIVGMAQLGADMARSIQASHVGSWLMSVAQFLLDQASLWLAP